MLGLFAISGFDAVPNAVGWLFLSITFGLAVAPFAERRPVLFGLVVGFGATIDILWELGEYLLLKSGSSGLQLTYDNTIQDLVLSLLGAAVAATVMATMVRPAAGTPATLFGWRTGPGA